MKNNKIIFVILAVIISLSFLFIIYTYFLYGTNKNIKIEPTINTTAIVYNTVYNNKEYGFAFTLPSNWNGYSIVKNTWEGNSIVQNTKKENGPKLLIRNPKWSESAPYQDIPVLIFTLAQWDSYIKENFSISAAPITASELDRNNKYVFALPPRWNFDYSKDHKEAEDIIKMNPLEAFDI